MQDALRTRVTGVLAHGRLMHCVVWPDHWIHDANHNFTCLLETLHLLTLDGQSLPKRLKMMLDNGPAENKNQSFLFCCWLLVYLDVFKEVSATMFQNVRFTLTLLNVLVTMQQNVVTQLCC